jgi:ubiquinone/menaquinone biosynthesis C-methylase UbiE
VLQFDEEASRRVEATYMTPDVVEQRRIVLASLDLQPGEAVLDVGSGPGLLAAEMGEAVGSEGTVQGIEPSESMLAIAERREPAAGSAPLEFQPGDAGALPFADASFDAIVATQVYEYVEDMPSALAEAHRVLRPGGRLLVLDTDWGSIVWRCHDAERMRRVLAAWDEHLADPYLPRRLTGLLEDAGFTLTERAAVPILNAGYDPDTLSAGLIGFVSAFVPGRQGLTEADAAAWADELVALGRDYFFSLNRYVFAARAGASAPDRSA